LPEADAAVLGRSVREALGWAAAVLSDAGCETPRLDAELLLGLALRCDRAQLVLRARERVDALVGARFDELVARRAAREPVAYITGVKQFRRLSLGVDRRVLIPRPETELLVDVGLSLPNGARVADVGTGSGAVALALKDERPDLDVVGIDVSHDALAVARENAARLGLDLSFLQGDLLAGRRYDAVLANLPYVSTASEVAPEVSVYEPAEALYAGDDGLQVLRRLSSMLDGVATVALEFGFDQADRVAALMGAAGFSAAERIRDLAGHERVVVGRR
jgi:release factor glutamine methyltransferase